MKDLLTLSLAVALLTGCEKVRIVSPEQAEMENRMNSLRAEDAGLQQKIQTLRQVLPPETNSLQAATQLSAKLEGDNQQISRQLTQAIQDYEATKTSAAKLQQEVDVLRKASAR
ncbi:hypothetical protein SAMN02745166_00542 [Prosthecobacter debontii]|uniref:Lipoprotein n=1 Tax=Prosthecobacter debontii TaxID=48467 RepID=A0A1T4WQY9_9BACT|nr:hypothetical protein [Prosthecobacter debontii]SKA79782.1 hypothetical protein SAMN02745166_00542 [Prosthecobacter debontii]